MSRRELRNRRRARYWARHRRVAVNLLWALGVTVLASVLVYVGIGSYVRVRSNELPPVDVSPIGSTSAYAGEVGYPSTTNGRIGATSADDRSGMRVCPATGCAASTCHAETGEPPGR